MTAPESSQRRLVLPILLAGAALTVAAAVAPYAGTGLLTDHLRAGYPDYSQQRIDDAVTAWLAILTTVGALGLVGWLVTLWTVRSQRGWAPWVATGLLAIGATVALTCLLITDTSGDTGLPPQLGWLGVLPCLPGIAIVVLLWTTKTRDSTVKHPGFD